MNDVSRAAVRVACDVGGTFTDVCVLDEATGHMRVAKTPTTPDPIDGVLEGIKAGGGRPPRHGLVLSRHHACHQRAHHAQLPARDHGDHQGLPRRDRDPPRHPRRPLGHLQGDGATLHQAPRPAGRHRAHRLQRRGRRAGERGGGARGRPYHQQARREDHCRLLRQRLRQPRERAAHARHPRGRSPRRVDLALERDHARDLRARALLDHGGQCGARARRRRLRDAPRHPPPRGRLR